jgi:hypothetical protein
MCFQNRFDVFWNVGFVRNSEDPPHDVLCCDHSFQIFALKDRQAPNLVLEHQFKGLLNSQVRRRCKKWVRHHLLDRFLENINSSDYLFRYVAFGNYSHRCPALHHNNRPDVMFNHQSRSVTQPSFRVRCCNWAAHQITECVFLRYLWQLELTNAKSFSFFV